MRAPPSPPRSRRDDRNIARARDITRNVEKRSRNPPTTTKAGADRHRNGEPTCQPLSTGEEAEARGRCALYQREDQKNGKVARCQTSINTATGARPGDGICAIARHGSDVRLGQSSIVEEVSSTHSQGISLLCPPLLVQRDESLGVEGRNTRPGESMAHKEIVPHMQEERVNLLSGTATGLRHPALLIGESREVPLRSFEVAEIPQELRARLVHRDPPVCDQPPKVAEL